MPSQRVRRLNALTTRLLTVILVSGTVIAARAADPELEIRVIYDNTSAREDVPADWGFSSVVTFRGRRALFDSGTKPDLFLDNLKKMGVEPSSIETAMISHQHPDHRNGVYKLYPLHRRMSVHFLEVFYDKAFSEAAAIGMRVEREMRPYELIPGAYSTGMIPGDPPEQSLAIETSKGIVLIVGCSHPGVVTIVEKVREQRGVDSIRLLLGGMHMFRQDEAQIREQIGRLKELKVQRVMPAHCSGEPAAALFQEMYGSNFERLGAGKVLRLD